MKMKMKNLGSYKWLHLLLGFWFLEFIECEIRCPNPGVPENGARIGSSFKVGEKVRFMCFTGYDLWGPIERYCKPNGQWHGEPTRCVSHNGAVFLFSRFSSVGLVGSGSRPLELEYPGRLFLYFAFDVSGSVGQRNFAKSIAFAKEIVRKVGISEDGSRAGALTFGSVATNMFLPMNFNNTEEVLNALDDIEYTGGGTSVNSALDLIRDNVFLVENFFDKKDKKTVLFLVTDGKVNMGGSPEVNAENLRNMGVENFCIGITGDVKADTLYKIASISKYSNVMRSNVFILNSYDTLSWLVQVITTVRIY